jgi:hypothetical protein
MTTRLLSIGLLSAAAALAQTPPVLVQQTADGMPNIAVLSVTMDQLPTPGNVLIVCHDSTSGANSSVSGGGVTNWILCQSSLPTQDNSEIWAGVVDGTPSAAIAITLGGSPNSACAIVSEWQGLATPLVMSSMATNGSGSRTSPAVSGSMSANAGDLVMATAGMHATGGVLGPATDGFIDLNRPPSVPSSLVTGSYLIPSVAGTYSTTWSLNFHHVWASAIVVFRVPVVPPPAIVQQAANSSTSMPSLTVSLKQLPLPGNLLVVCHDTSARANSTISGGGVTTWTLCQSSLPAKGNVEIWAGMVGSTPATDITIALAGGKGDASAVASEWDGFSVLPAFAGLSAGGSNGTASSPATTGSMPVAVDDLVIAAIGGGTDRETIGPPTNGFTDLARPAAKPGSQMAACSLVAAAAGSAATTWTLDARHLWVSALVVFHRL